MRKLSYKHKLILIFLLLIAISFGLIYLISGLKLSNWQESVGESEKITLRIINSWGNDDTKNRILSELLSEYSATHPEVSVSVESLFGKDFYIRLQSDFASSNGSDIIITTPGTNIQNLYAHGKLADLTSDLEADSAWFSHIDRSLLRFTSENETVYGIPTNTEYIAMYINEALFQQYNVPIPKTFSELEYAVSVFAANGVIPIAYGAQDDKQLLYQAIVASLAGKLQLEDAINVHSFADSYTKAFSYMQRLYQLKAFPENYASLDRDRTQSLFLDGSAAILIENADFAGIANLHKSPSQSTVTRDSFGVTVFPAMHETALSIQNNSDAAVNFTPIAYGAGNSTFFVSRSAYESKHNAVIHLVKFLTSVEASSQFYVNTGYFSAMKGLRTGEYKSKLIVARDTLMDHCTEFAPIPSDITDGVTWSSMIADKMPDILTGSIDTDSVAQMVQSAIETIEK